MSLPKIVFLHSSDELYGADRMLLEMVAAVAGDHEVEVWLPTDLAHPARPLCQELEARGTSVRHLRLPIMRRAYQNPRGLLALTKSLVRLVSALRKAQCDVVYCTTSAALLGAPAARIAGTRRVVGHFQEIWSRSDRAVLGTVARACHTTISISRAVSASLPAHVRNRTRVVPNGTPEPVPGDELSARTGPLTFLVASRWNGWKGHRTLLRAWDTEPPPGHLLVLGGPPPSGEAVDVEAIVAALKHPESVTIVGEVADSADHLNAADIVMMPSDQPEPFGLVAIEAFARGRPVIASAAGGLLDIVTAGHDGWLYPIRDAAALTSVLQSMDRSDAAAAGRNARASYQDRFTVERFRENWRSAALPG